MIVVIFVALIIGIVAVLVVAGGRRSGGRVEGKRNGRIACVFVLPRPWQKGPAISTPNLTHS